MVTRGVTISLYIGVVPGVTCRTMQHPLTRFRETAGISQAELARRANTTRSSINRIERGGQTPSMDLVRRLVDASERRLRADDFLPQEAR